MEVGKMYPFVRRVNSVGCSSEPHEEDGNTAASKLSGDRNRPADTLRYRPSSEASMVSAGCCPHRGIRAIDGGRMRLGEHAEAPAEIFRNAGRDETAKCCHDFLRPLAWHEPYVNLGCGARGNR